VTLPQWAGFVLGCIAYQILKAGWLIFEAEVKKRRDKRVLKLVQVTFPDNQRITFVAMASTDRRAFEKMKREIKSHYNVEIDEGVEGSALPRPVTRDPGLRQ
jgi:hypothetical protein